MIISMPSISITKGMSKTTKVERSCVQKATPAQNGYNGKCKMGFQETGRMQAITKDLNEIELLLLSKC